MFDCSCGPLASKDVSLLRGRGFSASYSYYFFMRTCCRGSAPLIALDESSLFVPPTSMLHDMIIISESSRWKHKKLPFFTIRSILSNHLISCPRGEKPIWLDDAGK